MIKDYKDYKSRLRQKRFNQAMDIVMGTITLILGIGVTGWWLVLATNY